MRSQKPSWKLSIFCLAAATLIHVIVSAKDNSDPLPSWNNGPAKQTILKFVADVIGREGKSFVPAEERVATFDNDGTLWVEQPIYTEFAFSIARVQAMAPQHPEWRQQASFKAALEGDWNALGSAGESGLLPLVTASHSGMSSADFDKTVLDWFSMARHPRFQRSYLRCAYEPMLELLRFLRTNGFKTYIASGGTTDFMRPWVEGVYGVPPQQTIGSSIKTQFETRNGHPMLMLQPEIDFVDDKAGKPVAIDKFIGRRPIAAFGNSDGDQQMLEWTAAGAGPRLALVVHHTDEVREYAYDRHSPIGRLDKLLDEAEAKSWVIVDMKRDWKVIFPQ